MSLSICNLNNKLNRRLIKWESEEKHLRVTMLKIVLIRVLKMKDSSFVCILDMKFPFRVSDE
jgi:hypothetical protein